MSAGTPVFSAASTELFVGPAEAPQQIVRVGCTGLTDAVAVRVSGAGLSGQVTAAAGDTVVELPVTVTDAEPGRVRAATLHAGSQRVEFAFVDAEPGWTMFMVSHFHYDPVWWNTQAAYTSEWTEDPPGRARQTNGFELVAAHLEMARRDPEYKFVLAEVDYLKPYWDTHPEDRDDLRRFIAGGRVEIMGGTYNEPNTNLTSPETAIRNFVAGIGFQRHIMGADPATAWQLDVFGHDPQFPGMAADAGLTSSSWARGPHHQWGPMAPEDGVPGDPERMQFCSEFEWIAPSGVGLLTHYMPAHYSAGWWMDSAATLTAAEAATHDLFTGLKKVASTRNVLLPVGTDYTPPNKWVTEIHRDWNARYTWPKFVCALPREFFAAVRAELDDRGVAPAPQTRDMNPIYTGKDVSFIDTKQANRAAEAAVLDAERFATFAVLLAGADYPEQALAKAWVQLAYGAHHDAITGSESDQVYLDLLTSWRDAWELGRTARDNALTVLADAVGGAALTVWNPLAHSRTDVVTAYLEQPAAGLSDEQGDAVPVLVEDDGRTLTFLACDVPSLGWRAYSVRPGSGSGSGWEPQDGVQIANAHYTIRVDPARGGGVESIRHLGGELLGDGRVGNEIAVYAEHPSHPKAGEGPWHLLPRGPVSGSSERPAEVRAYRSEIGERLVVRGAIEGLLSYTQTLTLWEGIDRLDCRTVIDDFSGENQLIRLRWPTPVPGALPVSEVGDAVVGRGFGLLHEPGTTRSVDTAQHPWTLENPAFGWFGLSSTARVKLGDNSFHSLAVAEVVTPDEAESAPLARDLMVALVRAGVTATCSGADKPRYGHLAVDSNLPDTRIALGGPQHNAFTAAVLADADPAYTAELHRQLDAAGRARVLVPAATPLAAEWVPDADLRGTRALPVLVIAASSGPGLGDEIAALTEDLADACIEVSQQVPGGTGPAAERTVAVFNRGVPSFAVEADGTLHTSLMRSCTGWPSGVWTTHEARRLPDGSNFQLQHWTHTFDYAVAAGAGDWRQSAIPARSAEFARPLLAVVGEPGPQLPAAGSLLRIGGAGLTLDALKPVGNPTLQGSASPPARDTTTLRIVEQHGAPARIAVSSDVAAVRLTGKRDLLEQCVRDGDPNQLHGFEIATLTAEFDVEKPVHGRGVRLAPDTETARPLYARYWLHNRGPAPLGGLPAVAHVHPRRLIAGDSPVSLRLTVAGDCVDARLGGTIKLVSPPGWAVTPRRLAFDLEPGGHRVADLAVTIPRGVAPGCYPVRAQLTLAGTQLPTAWRQTVEDVCLITVGVPGGEVLRLVRAPTDIVVAPGDSAWLTMSVGTDLADGVALEAHLISPWGTWEWLGPAVVGGELPAGGQTELQFAVRPPAWTQSGQWWALVRVAAAGALLYSPAVRVVVQ